MNQTNGSILTSFVANETIPAGARVKYIGAAKVALAGLADVEIGQAILDTGKSSYAAGTAVGIVLKRPLQYAIAAGPIVDGSTVKRAAAGKVAADGEGAACAIALEGADADGDVIVVMPLEAGPQGAVGPAGPQGEVGPAGPQGEPGGA